MSFSKDLDSSNFFDPLNLFHCIYDFTYQLCWQVPHVTDFNKLPVNVADENSVKHRQEKF